MAKRTDNPALFEMKWSRQQFAEIALSIGAALLIASYIRYTIQGELLRLTEILLIAGGVLLLASIVLGIPNIRDYFSKRSSQLGTNTTILTLGVVAILVVVNYLGQEHHKRFDVTTEKLYTLSDQTKKIVQGLTKDVTIIHFGKTGNQGLDDLVAEYKNLSPHIKFQNVDPQEKPEVAREYGASRMGDVVASSGVRKEHIEPGMSGEFSEQDITTTILKITRDKIKMVCFVTGHGEKSLSDDQARGYNLVDQGLKKEGYNTNSVNLVQSNGVPPDCDVVVVAGPTQAYFSQEAEALSKYLDNGGKSLIEVDPVITDKQAEPNLDSIFQQWNINVGKNIVIDASGMGRMFNTGPEIPLVADYGASPITKSLQGTMTFFPLARTVSIADKSKSDPQAVELLKTSPRSFTKSKLEHEVSYDPKTDAMGPLSLGVTEDRGEGGKNARLVVIGDSDFASNQMVSQTSNGDLLFNTIDWLAQDENLISIRPKSATNRRVTLTESQWSMLRWFDLFFLPGLVIFAGIYIWWKRR